MIKHLIWAVAFGAVVFSCTIQKDEKRASVQFVMKDYRAESETGCVGDTMQCAYYAVTYPEFSGLDSGVLRILQARIDATVSMGNPESEGKTMREIGEGFVRQYKEFKSEMPDVAASWHYIGKAAVDLLTDTLISISVEEEYYTGGAHGGYGMYFINIMPQTGASFTLDHFLKSGHTQPLTAFAEKIFRREREIPDTTLLSDAGFEFPDDKFQLNTNYGFRNEGIVFFYNSYEIASYAEGPTEILIPYEELSAWIR